MANQERYQTCWETYLLVLHTTRVGTMSQFMHKPQGEHMEAIYSVLRYLKGTPTKGIMLQKNGNLKMEAHTMTLMQIGMETEMIENQPLITLL